MKLTSVNIRISLLSLFKVLLSISSCEIFHIGHKSSSVENDLDIEHQCKQGGSSGMEKVSKQSYLAVYDLKIYEAGTRLGLIRVSSNSLKVHPIKIDFWDEQGISSDLESVCKIPGKNNEFLVAESGNWQGRLGRIFHIKLDTTLFTAKVIGSLKIPIIHINDNGKVGDQYEAIYCMEYSEDKRIILLGERGGSVRIPNGLVRWGFLDLRTHEFKFSDLGRAGIKVRAPGYWRNIISKRDITDFHVDSFGTLWSSASEDLGDTGPFYSVIYKLGKLDRANPEKPVSILDEFIWKDVNGLKIEALSGSCDGVVSSHSYGSEDEIYGGVWRPISILSN